MNSQYDEAYHGGGFSGSLHSEAKEIDNPYHNHSGLDTFERLNHIYGAVEDDDGFNGYDR